MRMKNLKYINHTIFMHNVSNVFTIELWVVRIVS